MKSSCEFLDIVTTKFLQADRTEDHQITRFGKFLAESSGDFQDFDISTSSQGQRTFSANFGDGDATNK